MKTQKYILASAVSFLMGAGGSGGVLAQDDGEEGLDWALEEIVVTATRRETSLNDTAISVAAIGGEEISRRNLTQMSDYLFTLPGVNFVETGLAQNAVVIRGIAASPQTEGDTSYPTTGIYLGEVSLTGLSGTGGNPDIKMIDLERVEVLRGPQGTLFGSTAMAGVVRNIPNAPRLDELKGSIKTTYSNTADSGGDNSQVEGVINVPVLKDVLAIRAVAYHHDTSGYVKNVAGNALANNGFATVGVTAADAVAAYGGAELYQNESEVGGTTYTGGRIAVLWQPSDVLNVTLMHAYQDAEQDGEPYVEPGLGDYEQVSLQLGSGPGLSGQQAENTDKINITSLVVEYDFGWATLLSSSGWVEGDSFRNTDNSSFFGIPIAFSTDVSVDTFSQDLRLVSQGDNPLQYVVGIFYEDIKSDWVNELWGATDGALAAFGNPLPDLAPLLSTADLQNPIEQQSYYGELSYRFTEQFELTVGARRFDYDRVSRHVGVGALGTVNIDEKFNETGTSGKLNLSYTPNDDMLLYLQWAEGFRLGRSFAPADPATCDVDNDGLYDAANVPIDTNSFESDTTENIELGIKLALLDKRLQVSAAIYSIDWEGIPVGIPASGDTCLNPIVANVGEARSQGFEFEGAYYPIENLKISFGGAYNNAEATEDVPELGAESGDRLPSSPDMNANLGLQYDFNLGEHSSYIAADYAYVDSFYNKIGEEGVKTGGYGQVNMSAGVSINDFDVELFTRNLTNEDALTHADVARRDDRVFRLRPRTIGVNLSYNF